MKINKFSKSKKNNLSLNKRTLTIVGLFVFIGFYIFLTLQTVASGTKLVSIEKQVANLTSENEELTANLVKATSLSKIDEASESYGFIKPSKTVYIAGESNVAKLP